MDFVIIAIETDQKNYNGIIISEKTSTEEIDDILKTSWTNKSEIDKLCKDNRCIQKLGTNFYSTFFTIPNDVENFTIRSLKNIKEEMLKTKAKDFDKTYIFKDSWYYLDKQGRKRTLK